MSSTLGYSTLDNYDDSVNSNNYIDQRRQSRNSTRKRRESFITNNKPNQNKLNPAILEQMHNMSNEDEDDGDAFNLLKTTSIGVEKAEKKEQEEKSKMQTSESMTNMNNDLLFRTLGNTPQPVDDSVNNLELNNYSNYGDEKKNEEYYKRLIAGYSQKKNGQINLTNKPYYSQVNYQAPINEDSVLLKKMNYMITLLEDQQDERTNNVTEEVILYSFLGIFIIFIADTFVRVGKYVR
jgi:hypothetical protein